MAQTLQEIGSGDPGRVIRALLGAALESPDRELVEACAVSLTIAADTEVRRAALLAIAHLARRFRQATVPALATVIERAGHDEALAGALDDLRDDLDTFGIAL